MRSTCSCSCSHSQTQRDDILPTDIIGAFLKEDCPFHPELNLAVGKLILSTHIWNDVSLIGGRCNAAGEKMQRLAAVQRCAWSKGAEWLGFFFFGLLTQCCGVVLSTGLVNTASVSASHCVYVCPLQQTAWPSSTKRFEDGLHGNFPQSLQLVNKDRLPPSLPRSPLPHDQQCSKL